MANRTRRRTLLEVAAAALATVAGCGGNDGEDDTRRTPTGTERTRTETTADGRGTGRGGSTAAATDATTGAPTSRTDEGPTPTTTGPSTEPTADATTTVRAYNQRSDGSRVVVDTVRIGRAGWVVVRTHGADGSVSDERIGHAPVEAGRSEDVDVTLERTLEESQSLTAILRYDDPPDGRLTAPDGDPVVERGGDVVSDEFAIIV